MLAAVGLDRLWQRVDQIQVPAEAVSYLRTDEFETFTLDHNSFQQLVEAAPVEFSGEVRTQVLLPDPTGSLRRFEFAESPIMAPELAAQFPEIQTFSGQGIDDPAATVRFDITPQGFHAQVLSPNGAWYIDPYYHLDTSVYASYFGSATTLAPEFHEHLEVLKRDQDGDSPHDHRAEGHNQDVDARGREAATSLGRSGTELRTYRTAVAATGEYTAFHGGTVSLGQAAIVTAINRVTGIYENELSIRLQLVATNNQLVYTNAGTDPYSNDDAFALLGENQSNIDSVIGDANYDLGHVFTTGGGGLAGLGVVGISGSKARGETGLSQPIGDPFYVDFVAHEIGHQFGGNHTFNGDSGSCSGGNRNGSTAYEPGSGSTIQAYAGICGDDNLQPNSDPYFHSISFDEMINYVDNFIPGVGTRTLTGNTVPMVNAGSDYTIPANTPFTLTATGLDVDGDTVTYNWEERDLGPQQDVNAPDNGSSPLWRSWTPTTDPSRTFPRLGDLVNNTTVVGEKFAQTTRAMNFRVTARDNRSGGGGVNTDDMVVNVVNTGAPFVVTAPNTGVSWAALSTQAVAWDVAGTTGNGINASNVNILLSTDGGLTYPITLAANTPNDGMEPVVIPNNQGSTARIMVEAAGNVFFDISNVNFTISAPVSGDDYGDAPDTYGTLATSSGAVHMVGGPVLGLLIDVEIDGQASADATGDGADEDGLTLIEPLVYGTTSNIQVTSSPGGGVLDYFFDFDGDGTFGNNPNEVFSAALSGGTETIPVMIPSVVGPSNTFARFRISTSGGLGPLGMAADGEVEDHAVQIFSTPPGLDFGDAPDTYGTSLADNGPRHAGAGPRLGETIDVSEADGQSSPNSTGDGTDEDGVTFLSALIPGSTAALEVSASSGGDLDYFFDFDGDGTFGNNTNEVFFTTLGAGMTMLAVPVPANAALGRTHARFRLSSTGGLGPLGFASDGEVEDYQTTIVSPTTVLLSEGFDAVSAPALPVGWMSSTTNANDWVTVANLSDTAPNSAFVNDIGTISDNSLLAPAAVIQGDNPQLSFKGLYSTESGFDGGVLEISIDGGAFEDILIAGGSFVSGGYVGTLSTQYGNPLGGRMSWTGNSGGFIDTTVNVPANDGQTVQFRWRMGTDESIAGDGWRIDTVRLSTDSDVQDFGDAPDPGYPTLLINGGAGHLMGGLQQLGAQNDGEPDGQPTPNADGDGPEDDGVILPAALTQGATAAVTIHAGDDNGLLNAWIDFNDDGDWSDPGERIFHDTLIAAGPNTLTFDVPSGALTTSQTFARFRLSTQAGLSFIGGAPDGEVEDYAVAIAPGSEALSLVIDQASISENGGTAMGTVTRSTGTSGNLSVMLMSDDTTEATVPPSIMILDGSDSATFTIIGIDDSIVDGTQTVTITAFATGFTDGTDMIDVTDDDVPALSVSIDMTSISENGGSATGTVMRNTGTAGDLLVSLVSDDMSEATVPMTVMIPDGMSEATFSITAVDDAIVDGLQSVRVTASATGFTDGTAGIDVTDDDVPTLSISIDMASISEKGGSATGTVTRNTGTAGDLTVSLVSDDTSEAIVPMSVMIPDGMSEATFAITAVDDSIVDGKQTVTVTATATGFVDGAGTIEVTDDDVASDPPVISNVALASTYTEGDPDLLLAGNGTVTDTDTPVLDAGTLEAVFTTGIQAGDTLSVINSGAVMVTGADVFVGGTLVGAIGNIVNGIAIALNNNATLANVQAVLNAIAFSNTLDDVVPGGRDVMFTVSDGTTSTSAPVTHTVTVAAVPDRPIIANLGGPVTFAYGDGPTVLTATGTLSDPDNHGNWGGATLNVSISRNGDSFDRLTIAHIGNGPDEIGVVGANVFFEGAQVGSFSGGVGTNPLQINFIAGSTEAAIQALIRAIRYENVNTVPVVTSKDVSFEITDPENIVNIVDPNGIVSVNLLSTNRVRVDTSFDGDGILPLDPQTGAVDIQLGRQLLVIRHLSTGDGWKILRYNEDGSQDMTFGTQGNGEVTTQFSGETGFSQLTIVTRSDGKFVAASTNGTGLHIAVYDQNGSPDASFDTDGKLTVPAVGFTFIYDIQLLNNGKVLFLYEEFDTVLETSLRQLNADGTPDTGFGIAGTGKIDLTNQVIDPFTLDLALDSSGNIFVSDVSNDFRSFELMRFLSNGLSDTTFGTNGTASILVPAAGTNPSVFSTHLAIDTNQRPVIAGDYFDDTSSRIAVSRFTDHGMADSSFGTNGAVLMQHVVHPTVNDIVIQDNNSVLVLAGDIGNTIDQMNTFLFRLKDDGSSDTSFDADGFYTLNKTAGFGSEPVQMMLLSDGRLVVATAELDGFGLPDLFATRLEFGYHPTSDVLTFDPVSGRWYRGVSNGNQAAFQSVSRWSTSAGWQLLQGDFNGDGLEDVAGITATGQWWIGRSHSGGLDTTYFGQWGVPSLYQYIGTGDFNGDGRTDVAGIDMAGQWWVGTSNGSRFSTQYTGRWNATGWTNFVIGDFDGNGQDDIAGFREFDAGEWWLRYSTGPMGSIAFTSLYEGRWSSTANWGNFLVDDFTGDGRDDISAKTASGQWWRLSQPGTIGSRFQNNFLATWGGTYTNIASGDFNGDGFSDIIGRDAASQWWTIDGQVGGNQYIGRWNAGIDWITVVGDFNSNGQDDIAGYDPVTGQWWLGTLGTTRLSTSFFGSTAQRGIFNFGFGADLDDED